MNKKINKKFENNEPEKISLKLKLDKDFNKLLEASTKTGIPLTFSGDRIVDFKIHNNTIENIIPDKIEIGPPAILFDIIIGENILKKIPFERTNINENIMVLNSTFYSSIEFKIKIKITKNDEKRELLFNISINPKSNNIKDILNYELLKKDFSNKILIIKLSEIDQKVFEGKLPKEEYDENLIKFYKKIVTINEKMNLNLTIDEEYVIRQDDIECADSICAYLENKKIPITNLSINMEIDSKMLYKFIYNTEKKLVLEQNSHIVKLLGNEINLGSCKIQMNNYTILNEEELINILESNKENDEKLHITIILKENNSEEFYLDFN